MVQITVDQLRGDLPMRYRERLGQGGFRYLLETSRIDPIVADDAVGPSRGLRRTGQRGPRGRAAAGGASEPLPGAFSGDRLFADVTRNAHLGVHHSGKDPDRATSDWQVAHLERHRFATERQRFDVPQFFERNVTEPLQPDGYLTDYFTNEAVKVIENNG